MFIGYECTCVVSVRVVLCDLKNKNLEDSPAQSSKMLIGVEFAYMCSYDMSVRVL